MEEKNKSVWITGASSGIGKSIALEFINNSVTTIISARREEALKKLSIDNKSKKEYVNSYPLDISNSNEVERVVKKILKNFDVNCLINSAGITSFKSASDNTIEEIAEIINTNLLGSISTIQNIVPHFKKRGGGIIINIVSVAAIKVFQNSSVYSASKAGLLAFTNVLREEVRDDNIKIINVLPGATKTPIWPSESLEKHADRMMSPNDVARFIYQIYKSDSNMVPEEIVLRPAKGDL